jgi:ribose 5-phosphate isomerase RpiB
MSSDGQVLRWNGTVLSALDLRGALNGHREVVVPERTVITPSAAEELRARGVGITRQSAPPRVANQQAAWGYAQDRPYPLVESLTKALEREGIQLRELAGRGAADSCAWARQVAVCIARGECCGGLVFSQESELVSCVANKVPGVRAASVSSPAQAARATTNLGANLLVVDMTGRTLFEIRQMIRGLCSGGIPACPAPAAHLLQELDGHAHR